MSYRYRQGPSRRGQIRRPHPSTVYSPPIGAARMNPNLNVRGAAKYPGRDVGQTFVRQDGIITRKGPARAAPTNLKKETRDWLTQKTIPTVREIARDLENAGEDVRDLIEAIDELEMLLRDGPRRNGFVRP